MRTGLTLVATSLLAVSSPGLAQVQDHAPAVACPSEAAPLPAELSGWAAPQPMRAANSPSAASATGLPLGKSVDLELFPTPEVSYLIRPERPAGSVSQGGLVTFRIETAGTYRIAIDNAAWLDLIHEGKALESSNHGQGPACSGIRKMVDFGLAPGTYTLQIAGSGRPNIHVLLASLPAK